MIDVCGDEERQAVRNQLRGDDAIESHKMIHDQQGGDCEQALPELTQNKRFRAFAHGLQAENLLEIVRNSDGLTNKDLLKYETLINNLANKIQTF